MLGMLGSGVHLYCTSYAVEWRVQEVSVAEEAGSWKLEAASFSKC